VRAATVCAEPECWRAATKGGRCALHQLPKSRAGSTRRYRKQRARVLARDDGVCWICGEPGADSVDHIVRVRDGGTDDPANLAAVHLACNLRRG
jgi:5-methylcytosine-specific restriction endonuclease McrA